MDREPAGADGGERPPGVRVSRRLAAAGAAAGVAALIAIAVLATSLASTPAAPGPAPAASPSPSPSASTLTVPGVYQRVEPSLVLVKTSAGFGSGVIVADSGTIVTADHVVAGSKTITVTFADGTTAKATLASADAKTDIATLTPTKLPSVVVPATLGGDAAVGDAVIAIGNPLGLTDSVSTGVVSGLNRNAKTDNGNRSGLIQFDAAVNPGSSGGPLLDSQGMVIGIVVALADPDGQDSFAGIGFAEPIGSALGGGQGSGPREPQI
jgi:putative serine protease PepD